MRNIENILLRFTDLDMSGCALASIHKTFLKGGFKIIHFLKSVFVKLPNGVFSLDYKTISFFSRFSVVLYLRYRSVMRKCVMYESREAT